LLRARPGNPAAGNLLLAAYGGAVTMAKQLGHKEAAPLREQGKAADQKLKIPLARVHKQAPAA
jgi:ferritin-like metal-binding protein YciE